METRVLIADGHGGITVSSELPAEVPDGGWVWVDAIVGDDETDGLVELTAGLRFDPMAVADAVGDIDLPKVDDFGHHLLVILHGLRSDSVATYEVDCFLTATHLVTVHREPSPALDAMWARIQDSPELAAGGVDELLGRIAGVLTRRLLAVVDAFDDQAEGLVLRALSADPDLVADLTAIRGHIADVRRVVVPQRESLDLLRTAISPLISDAGKRRFSDGFDVAVRAAADLESARVRLAEILDAYRGAEARLATDVTKVLTIYAAIMLPLSLVAGFFGMNFTNLPWITSDWGWVIVTVAMALIAIVSLGVFVGLGWMTRPSGRRAGAALGKGLAEAARSPAHIVGAAYEITTMPLRATVRRRSHRDDPGA